MHLYPFRAVLPNASLITSTDSFFGSVKEEYPEYVKSGFFSKTQADALYVYQIRAENRHYTGILACADVRDYLSGHIRKHEDTLASKEQKQLQLLLKRKAAVKPVMLTYPEVPALTRWTQHFIDRHEPVFDFYFEAELQHHLIWQVSLPQQIRELQDLYARHIPVAYIADGHHRTSAGALLYQRAPDAATREHYRKLLCGFFPSTDLEVLDFNRVIDVLGECSTSWFMARIAQLFDIEILSSPTKPRCKHELLMLINREWYMLHWKPQILAAYANHQLILDNVLLNEKILCDIFGITDVRHDQRIEYVEGPKGLDGLWRKTVKSPTRIGFCLHPILMEEIMAIADAGKTMPPKSTWFEPRMRNGLVVYDLQ